ncbi:MAG: CRISPR-associated protein Cas4 [Lentisphaerae bacterium]|nr:CRISPR-associated protein Cas4 [Lentisphaerota bacterium]
MSSVQTPPSPAYPDDQLIQLSALQHLIFCERQFALIHIEQVWDENRLTAEGRVLHESVDQAGSESRRDVRQATAVRIKSHRLGLIGMMDMLEFHRASNADTPDISSLAVRLPRSADLWIPFPVEYKRGKPKDHRADEVQLCAQAICLEEMLNVEIKHGALFYGQPRRRADVTFDSTLRNLTAAAAQHAHELIAQGTTPVANYTPKCRSCSMNDSCQPQVKPNNSAKAWLDKEIERTLS